jgi:hypothetical protein
VGLFVTGLVTLLCWIGTTLFVIFASFNPQAELHSWQPSSHFWLFQILVGFLIVPVSTVLMTSAVMMRRLRWYPLAATSSILAMIPWSPGWLIGLVFGIWTCIILGKPEVVEAFYPSRALAEPASTPVPRAAIAGRFRSLLRSMGRYMLPTFRAARSATSQTGGEQSSIEDPMARATVDDAGTPRPPSTGRTGHNGQ